MMELDDMKNDYQHALNEVLEEFDSVQSTEDPRTGGDRRKKAATKFPLTDNQGNIIAEDRRKQDRRNVDVDINDIDDYTS